jgi:hypothetical protein
MMLGPILLTWILFGTVTTVQCKGTDCHPTRTSQAVAGPHKMAVFHTPAACELSRQTIQQMHQQAVHSPTQPAVTVRKEYTFTCQESEEAL